MSKLEALKEQLAYLRLWLGILIVTGISLSGWLLTHLDAAPWFLLAGTVLTLMSIGLGCSGLHLKIESKISEILEL